MIRWRNQKQYTGWAYPDEKCDFSIGESLAVITIR